MSRPQKPKNSLLKLAYGLLGLLVLLAICALAIIVGVIMLLASFMLKLFRKKPGITPAYNHTIDAEYTVVKKSPLTINQ